MKITGLGPFYHFPGWKVDAVCFDPVESIIKLSRDERYSLTCPHCGKKMTKSREIQREALDLPMGLSMVVKIRYPAIQGRCRSCQKYTTIVPEEIGPLSRATWRLKRLVSHMCRHTPALRVGDFLPLRAKTVIDYDREVLGCELPEPDLDDLRVLLIDEKAIGKRRSFVTLVMNGETGELLYMVEGKTKDSLRGFFDMLSDEQKASIEAVGIDRSNAYSAVVKEQLPNAAIVWDKFHLVANLNDVVRAVRLSAVKNAKPAERQLIKGQFYNLYRVWDHLDVDQKIGLRELLDINENLCTTYVLADAFRKVWTYRYRRSAEKYLDTWIDWAKESGVALLADFALKIAKAKDGILNFCRHNVTTGRLEGFNNLISRIIHRSCGIRDVDYLFLKLRQQSLGSLSA